VGRFRLRVDRHAAKTPSRCTGETLFSGTTLPRKTAAWNSVYAKTLLPTRAGRLNHACATIRHVHCRHCGTALRVSFNTLGHRAEGRTGLHRRCPYLSFFASLRGTSYPPPLYACRDMPRAAGAPALLKLLPPYRWRDCWAYRVRHTRHGPAFWAVPFTGGRGTIHPPPPGREAGWNLIWMHAHTRTRFAPFHAAPSS